MAHLTSAPALRCARVILKEYTLGVRPDLSSGRIDGLTCSERHVATLIDCSTNVYRVVALRPELHYWQRRLSACTATAPQIAAFLSRTLEELSSVPRRSPQDEQQMTTFAMPNGFAGAGMMPERRPLAKFAVEASRVLFHYYSMEPVSRKTDDMRDRTHVAELVDSVLGLSRVLGLEPVLNEKKAEIMAGHVTEQDVRNLMRSAGVFFDKMPSYANGEEEAMLLS